MQKLTSISLITVLALVGCGGDDGDDGNPGADAGGDITLTLTVSLDGLPDIGADYVYEGWVLVDGAPVTTGRFSSDGSASQTFDQTVTVATDPTAYILTIETAVGDAFTGVISLDLRALDQVLEVDRTSRAARIQAGILGPALETALKPHGVTLRHFPQSFEFSTLGGWIATRSGGHFATLYTHIDDFVESLRVVSPAGVMESRRLPGSGAGPSPDRLMIGSEGALGVITEAWMRLQDRPRFRAGAALGFPDIDAGAAAIRAVAQAGLYPSNLRLLDAQEAAVNGAGDGSEALAVLAFESADHPVDAWMDRALELMQDHGGRLHANTDAAEAWRTAFIRMPYNRELLVPLDVIADTFETAITWDRFQAFHDQVKATTEEAIREATGQDGLVTCRFTHVYPDGPAPYFTFHCLGRPNAVLEQWQHIKEKASDAVIDAGGTITHHHAVGRDHMPWYQHQRPPLFGEALAAAKRALDPAGMLNPGVLVPL